MLVSWFQPATTVWVPLTPCQKRLYRSLRFKSSLFHNNRDTGSINLWFCHVVISQLNHLSSINPFDSEKIGWNHHDKSYNMWSSSPFILSCCWVGHVFPSPNPASWGPCSLTTPSWTGTGSRYPLDYEAIYTERKAVVFSSHHLLGTELASMTLTILQPAARFLELPSSLLLHCWKIVNRQHNCRNVMKVGNTR